MPVRPDLSSLRASMTRVLANNPGCAGKTLFSTGKYEEASVEFEKSLKENSNDLNARSNLVLCYLKLNNYQAALDTARESLKLKFSPEQESIRRKLIFRKALAREGIGLDDEDDIEDLRELVRAYTADGKSAEAKVAQEIFDRLVKSQRIRHLKEAARAEGWAIDSPTVSPLNRTRKNGDIDEESDYFRISTDGADREIKTIRTEDPEPVILPPEVEERLRNARAEKEFTFTGPLEGVRPIGEPVPEFVLSRQEKLTHIGPKKDDVEYEDGVLDDAEETELEPQLKFYAEFADRGRWKKDLLARWAKFG